MRNPPAVVYLLLIPPSCLRTLGARRYKKMSNLNIRQRLRLPPRPVDEAAAAAVGEAPRPRPPDGAPGDVAAGKREAPKWHGGAVPALGADIQLAASTSCRSGDVLFTASHCAACAAYTTDRSHLRRMVSMMNDSAVAEALRRGSLIAASEVTVSILIDAASSACRLALTGSRQGAGGNVVEVPLASALGSLVYGYLPEELHSIGGGGPLPTKVALYFADEPMSDDDRRVFDGVLNATVPFAGRGSRLGGGEPPIAVMEAVVRTPALCSLSNLLK